MSAQISFREQSQERVRFRRVKPPDFSRALNEYLERLPGEPAKRSATILDTLRHDDHELTASLFNVSPIKGKEIDTYDLHEGDHVLAAMVRRILTQSLVNARGMKEIVDDSEFRDAIDSAGLATRVQNFGHYMRETWRLKDKEIRSLFKDTIDSTRVSRIVLPGAMGGSAIGVSVVKMLLANQGYESNIALLPHYPSRTTPLHQDDLAIMYSYSGNTEEMLLWMDMVEASGAQVVGFSTGGRLREICREKGYPYIEIPGKSFNLVQPREHLPVSIVLLLALLGCSGLAYKSINGERMAFDYDKWLPKLKTTSKKLGDLAETTYNVDLPFEQSIAKHAALFLNWATTDPDNVTNVLQVREPVFWASSFYEPIARRFENQFGECVEQPAPAKTMPEDLHNEQEAYVEQWIETIWNIGNVAGKNTARYNNVFCRFSGPLDERLATRAEKVFNDFLAGAPCTTFQIQEYGDDYPMLGELEALLFCDLTRAFCSVFRSVTPHYVHSMNYGKHFMATVPGGPGTTGKY